MIPILYFGAYPSKSIPIGGLMFFLSLSLHIGFAFANAYAAENLFDYILLSIHLFIATAIGYPLWMMIRYASSALVDLIPIAMVIGLLGSLGCSVFSFILFRKKLLKKSKGIWIKIIFDIIVTVVVLLSVNNLVYSAIQPRELIIKNEGEAVLHCDHRAKMMPDLSESDRQKLVDIMDHHMLHLEIPRYPRFFGSYSIQIGDEIFLIGEDNSGIIKYNKRYFHLNEEETQEFFEILRQYGMR